MLNKTNVKQNGGHYLNLTVDMIFKAFFKDKSVSIPFLQNFLPLPKERKITSLNFLDPVMTPENIKNKTPVLDLRVQLDNKEYINIEMQTMEMESFKERILYYLSSLYISQLGRGTDYSTLYPAYSLVFTKFTVFPELKEYYSHFSLRTAQKGGPVFSNHLGIILVELEKFKERSFSHLIDKKDLWSYIIKNSHHINSEELRDLSKKGGGMKEATERLRVLSKDENLRLIEEAREKAWRDERARRAYSIKEGLKEGMQKGMQEGMQKGMQKGRLLEKNEMILKMLNKDFNITNISEITGASKAEILKLKNT